MSTMKLVGGEKFPELSIALTNEQSVELGQVKIVDVSNTPFVRPRLECLLKGIAWVRENNYPIRGAYQ